MSLVKCNTKLDLYNRLLYNKHIDTYYYIGRTTKDIDYLFVWHEYLFYSKNIPLNLSYKQLNSNWDKYKNYCIAITDRYDANIIINLAVDYNVNQLGNWAIQYYNNVFVSNTKFDSANLFELEPNSSTGRLNRVLWLYSQYLIQQFVKVSCYDLYLATQCLHNPKQVTQNIFRSDDDNNDNVIEFWKKNPKVTYNDILFLVEKFTIKSRPFYNTKSDSIITLNNKNNNNSYSFNCPSIKQIINNTWFNTKQKHDIEKKYLYYKHFRGIGVSYKVICNYYYKKYINNDDFQKWCDAYNIDITKRPKETTTAIQSLIWLSDMVKQRKIKYIEECVTQSNDNYEKALAALNNKCNTASDLDKTCHRTIIVYYKRYIKQKGSKGFWSISFVSRKL